MSESSTNFDRRTRAHQPVPDAEERIRAERRRVFSEMPRSEFAAWVREKKSRARRQRVASGKPVPQRVCATPGCDRPAYGLQRHCRRCHHREHQRMVAAARAERAASNGHGEEREVCRG